MRRSGVENGDGNTQFIGKETDQDRGKEERDGIYTCRRKTDLPGGDRPVRAVYPVDLHVKKIIDDISCRRYQRDNSKEQENCRDDRTGCDQVRNNGRKAGSNGIHRPGDGKKASKAH